MIEKFKSEDDGVSPVIGVILLVAVTVALVALATVIVFDIGSDVSETADATVQLNGVSFEDVTNADANSGTGSGVGVQATVVRNENVQTFNLIGPGTASVEFSNVGDTVSVADGSGTYTVVATLEDGTEEVLTSTDR